MKRMWKETVKENWNVPNVLTLIRLLLIPVYVVFFTHGAKYQALTVFLVASFTDFLDGYIARKYKLITNFGKLMDPLADKIMVLSATLSMAIGNSLIAPVIPWAVVIILLGKEMLLISGSLFLYKQGFVAYSYMIGKVAHCFFIAGLVMSYFHEFFLSFATFLPFTLDLAVLWIAVALTLCALVFYTINNYKKAKKMGIF